MAREWRGLVRLAGQKLGHWSSKDGSGLGKGDAIQGNPGEGDPT